MICYTSYKYSCLNICECLLHDFHSFTSLVLREEMHRDQLLDKDIVIAVGGDGTVLNSASFLNDKIPILGTRALIFLHMLSISYYLS